MTRVCQTPRHALKHSKKSSQRSLILFVTRLCLKWKSASAIKHFLCCCTNCCHSSLLFREKGDCKANVLEESTERNRLWCSGFNLGERERLYVYVERLMALLQASVTKERKESNLYVKSLIAGRVNEAIQC